MVNGTGTQACAQPSCASTRASTVLNSARISAKPASTAPRSSFTSVSMSIKRPQRPLSIAVILHTSCFVFAIRCFWMMSIAVSTRFCAS